MNLIDLIVQLQMQPQANARQYSLLNDQTENDFSKWYSQWADKLRLNPNPDDPRHFYDYRGAFLSGFNPSAPTGWHFPSQFKLQGHPRMILDGVNTKTGQRIK